MTDAGDNEALAGENRGYYKIPGASKRAAMTVEDVAVEISKAKSGSPSYIILSHELNLKLAKEQAKATLSAGWLGAGATLLAVLISSGLGYWAGISQSKETNSGPSAKHAGQPASDANGNKFVPVPAAVSSSKVAPGVPSFGGNTQPAGSNGKGDKGKP